MNRVFLLGRVGKDPESRFTTSGTQVVSFSLATSEKYKDKQGNKQEDTQWHNLVLWKKLAEIAEKYVNKGDQLLIEGKVSNRSYDDRDGNKKYISEIIVSNLEMLGGSREQKTEPDRNEPVFDPNEEIQF
jgi:single-strand DNA-binding protein